MRIASDIGHVPLALEVLAGVATLLAAAGAQEQARAAELFAFVRQHPASDEPTQNRAEQGLADLAAQMLPDTVFAAQAWGEAAELEQVVTELLD